MRVHPLKRVSLVAGVVAIAWSTGCGTTVGLVTGSIVDEALFSRRMRQAGPCTDPEPGTRLRGTTVEGRSFEGIVAPSESLEDGRIVLRVRSREERLFGHAEERLDTLRVDTAYRVRREDRRHTYRTIGAVAGGIADILVFGWVTSQESTFRVTGEAR